MKEQNIKNLIEKYKSGKSSLQEEELLFETVNESEPEIKRWSTFVKNHKKETPENLNSKLWDSFEKDQKKKSRFKIGIFSGIAASFLLMIFLYNNHSIKSDYQQKEALLKEVKSMFETNEETKYLLIVENDLIAVYTKE